VRQTIIASGRALRSHRVPAQRVAAIDETPGLTVSELRANARRLVRQCDGKLGLIVVDYLQFSSMSTSTNMGDENCATAVGEISGGLKLLAKELGCPVIALSVLSRGVESHRQAHVMSDCANPAPLSRTPASSCSSTATTTTRTPRHPWRDPVAWPLGGGGDEAIARAQSRAGLSTSQQGESRLWAALLWCVGVQTASSTGLDAAPKRALG
jgi:hypothetical protein